MKKSLLTLLLAVAMAVPAFAVNKGSIEIVGKLGYIIEPLLMETESDGDKWGYNAESTFSLGADFYYYVVNNLGLGVGVNHIFASNMNDSWGDKSKVGATNIYLSVKPVFELQENKFIDRIYFLGQLGYGIMDSDKISYSNSSKKLDNGMYWGIGAGVEKCNIIVELMYSVNYSHFDYWGGEIWTYRNIAINAGYKFNI